MILLTLDERTLLTIRNALWLTQRSAAEAAAAIEAQIPVVAPSQSTTPPTDLPKPDAPAA